MQSRHTAVRMDHDPGRSNNRFTVIKSRPAGAEYLLLDSGAHLRACPIKLLKTEHNIALLWNAQRVELASNMMEDVW